MWFWTGDGLLGEDWWVSWMRSSGAALSRDGKASSTIAIKRSMVKSSIVLDAVGWGLEGCNAGRKGIE